MPSSHPTLSGKKVPRHQRATSARVASRRGPPVLAGGRGAKHVTEVSRAAARKSRSSVTLEDHTIPEEGTMTARLTSTYSDAFLMK
jgi:hypothetical protein